MQDRATMLQRPALQHPDLADKVLHGASSRHTRPNDLSVITARSRERALLLRSLAKALLFQRRAGLNTYKRNATVRPEQASITCQILDENTFLLVLTGVSALDG